MYDVVIVGAGTTGLTAAKFIAEKGYKVLVVDLRSEDDIGNKVCGDAISKEYFGGKIPLSEPPEYAIEGRIVGAKIYSPDEKTVWTVPGEGFMLNRRGFGKWLYSLAREAGAEFSFSTRALGPIVKDGKVKGITVRRGDKVESIESRLVVDASGVVSIIRRALPKSWPVAEELDFKDTAIAYREIRKINYAIEDEEYIRIYVSQEKAPGGYWWLFPYPGKMKVNVGLGVQGGVGHKDPMWYFNKYLANRIGGEVLHAGGGVVPTRRPLDTMVADGFAAAGDAAYQVNPIHGGGIGSGMLGAYLLAKNAVKALEEEPTIENLWQYNVDFMEAYGAKQAALDVFRIFLQSLSDEEINYGMRNKIIKEEDLLKASLEGDLKISSTDKLMRVIKALGKPSLLSKLKTVADYMKEVKELYLNYPKNPSEFDEWRKRVNELFNEYKNVLSKK
ncbi:geranylgeranyl hydrogenase [Ignicoccus islandicus DSM 13165]|uniref:Geranylgeranyl hydrogenase n=1 Tax=Ignicoccus islandicus DSM 13165 TaxID=940295 RepID=A0A0U3G0N9_9CREN|nr:digeranylgeranylglycerophospholipid reductase [Ignicoccus islandicus]ALU11884.1 geranylgeranyl hydrogenase [Ignicoccus islandicus DSM 13165]